MPETDLPPQPSLYDQLYDAGSTRVHEGQASNRKIRFTEVVRLMEHAIGDVPVLYATHSFEESNAADGELAGAAISVTNTLIASVLVTPHERLQVQLTPLSAVSAVTVSQGDIAFQSNDRWHGVTVTAQSERHSMFVVFPSVRSSIENTERFGAFYPRLIEALETP